MAKNSSMPMRAIGITSCYRREGVSTLAAHLAAVAASSTGRRVLLADANVVRPSVHRVFQIDRAPGLVETVAGAESPAAYVQPAQLANLSLLAAGAAGRDPSRVYDATEGFEALVGTLKEEFRLVFFDMPALGDKCPAMNLFHLLDGVILVVEAERVRWQVAKRAQRTLEQAGAQLLGVVMNKRRQYIPGWLYGKH